MLMMSSSSLLGLVEKAKEAKELAEEHRRNG
jgi:hypothetical protein